MNYLRTDIGRMALFHARLAVLIASIACLLCFPWDTQLVVGNVGCLTLGVRIWVVGLALLATAAVWFSEFSEAKAGW